MTFEDGTGADLQMFMVDQLVGLRRDGRVASGGRALEGVFTCNIPGDSNTPVSVGIYYPSELQLLYNSFTQL